MEVFRIARYKKIRQVSAEKWKCNTSTRKQPKWECAEYFLRFIFLFFRSGVHLKLHVFLYCRSAYECIPWLDGHPTLNLFALFASFHLRPGHTKLWYTWTGETERLVSSGVSRTALLQRRIGRKTSQMVSTPDSPSCDSDIKSHAFFAKISHTQWFVSSIADITNHEPPCWSTYPCIGNQKYNRKRNF